MNSNGYGPGESGERDDAAAEPLPWSRPAPGRHTFSPLRFESDPESASPYPASGSTHGGGYGSYGGGTGSYGNGGYGNAAYPDASYPDAAYPDGSYPDGTYPGGGNGSYPNSGNGWGYASPDESAPMPPGPYPSQLPTTPYVSRPPSGPFTSEFDLGELRRTESAASMGSRFAYDTGTYGGNGYDGNAYDGNGYDGNGYDGYGYGTGYDRGDGSYGGDGLSTRSRYGAADLDVRPGVGGRHARPDSGPEPRRPRRRPAPTATDDGERAHMPLWQELPLLLVVAFCLAVLIRSFLLQAFFIPSSSMEATLLVGDRVLVNKVIYDLRDPERGEIVVFRGTDKWAPENYVEPAGGVMSRIGRTLGDLVGVSRPGEKDFIKRVIGLPGDHVACCDDQGRVTVNGVGIDEPYINVNSSLDVPYSPGNCGSRRFDEVVVPAGQIFVMGDNRIVSQDARCQGPVPIENVIGRAFVIVWPSSRWDGLSVPDNFANVPAPPAALGAPAAESPQSVGAAIVTLPILATLVVSAASGRKGRWRPRRLRG